MVVAAVSLGLGDLNLGEVVKDDVEEAEKVAGCWDVVCEMASLSVLFNKRID